MEDPGTDLRLIGGDHEDIANSETSRSIEGISKLQEPIVMATTEGDILSFSAKNGCPCCAFDIFLPPSERLYGKVQCKETYADSGQDESHDFPMAPQEALNVLHNHFLSAENTGEPIVIVDTHGHAQLNRDRDETYDISNTTASLIEGNLHLKTIACAVEPADWKATLELASRSSHTLPALGIHPWYLGEGLPDRWLEELETLLVSHCHAMVGEIGLCKMARWTRQYPEGKAAALNIQREVFRQQLQLAAKLRRPVSVHCVNQHGAFVSVIKEAIEQAKLDGVDPQLALPPAISMHSFTGTAHHAKELLNIEKGFRASTDGALFYFGFSHAVNFVMNTSDKSRRKGREAVRAIPSDRILVESDVHSSSDLLGGTAGAISYVSWARGEKIHEVAHITSQNGLKFISSIVEADH